jgi:hypothetical protein
MCLPTEGVGYPVPDLADFTVAIRRPKCVEGALDGMRIVSVAAGDGYTIVATDQGAARQRSFGLAATRSPEAPLSATARYTIVATDQGAARHRPSG